MVGTQPLHCKECGSEMVTEREPRWSFETGRKVLTGAGRYHCPGCLTRLTIGIGEAWSSPCVNVKKGGS